MGYRPGSSGGGGGSAATGETIIAATVSGSNNTVISKNKTISNPSLSANVYLALPSASAAVAYQDYEIKDGAGNADLKPITITTLSGSIDGATEDVIDARWGSKTYYTDSANWFVKDRTTKVVGLRSGGGSYLAPFDGVDGTALPTGWSSTTSGTGIDWLISEDTFHSDGANTSSVGSDPASGAASTSAPAIATLFYNAGTLEAGKVIKFRWLRDTWDNNTNSGTTGYYNKFRFEVNGVIDTTHSLKGAWQIYSYTVPSTGTYVFSWLWTRLIAVDDSSLNGCFLDEFEILDAPVPTYSNSFDGVEHAALPTGWSATTTGVWPADSSGWLHQEGIYSPAGASTSSLGEHWDGTVYGNILPMVASSKLTYNAGTLAAGTVISFMWMKDFVQTDYKIFTFEVNGVVELTSGGFDNGNWVNATYTIPSTGTYILDWQLETPDTWRAEMVDVGYANGCFIDEFKIF